MFLIKGRKVKLSFKLLISVVLAAVLVSVVVLMNGCHKRDENSSGPSGAAVTSSKLVPFRFHLKYEPTTLNPAFMTSGESVYLFSNVFRGLTRFRGGRDLIFDQAERCESKPDGGLLCKIRKEALWDDGKPVTAQQFVDRFRDLLKPGSHFAYSGLLMGLKNAHDVAAGKKPPTALGVTALSEKELRFDFVERDNEFLEKLSNPLLVPLRNDNEVGLSGLNKTALHSDQKEHSSKSNDSERDSFDSVRHFNGPYKIKEHIAHEKIVLVPNEKYSGFDTTHIHPNIEIVFAPEDSSAVTLYQKGIINFLWRLPDGYINQYLGTKEFHDIPQARFDYVGFNMRDPRSLFYDKNIRKAFVSALDFKSFRWAFQVAGDRLGCPGVDDPFLVDPSEHCLDLFKGLSQSPHDSAAVGSHFQNQITMPGPGTGSTVTMPPLKLSRRPIFYFSRLGGDDIKKQVEWFQEQWRKNLGVEVELRGLDQKQFVDALQKGKPDLFRKGVMLTRPTCLAGLEVFQKDNADNFTGFSNLHFENLTHALWAQKTAESERADICATSFDLLFKQEFVGIPLGIVRFHVLSDPRFKGWHLNELNQLDLTSLYEEIK